MGAIIFDRYEHERCSLHGSAPICYMSSTVPTMQPPYPLIPLPYTPILANVMDDIQENLHIDMTLFHNIFIRGLNSIWTNAPLVEEAVKLSPSGRSALLSPRQTACYIIIHF